MSRIVSLDLMRFFLAIMVVGLHAGFLKDVNEYVSFLTVEGLFRIAVPLFFIINGYFYYFYYERKDLNFFKKLLLMYCFWMLFYFFYWFRPSGVSLDEVLKYLHIIVFGYYHLWFLPGVIGAALLFNVVNNGMSFRLIVLIITLYLCGVAIQYVGNYHLIENETLYRYFNYFWVHRNFLFFGFPFFGIGYLFKKHNIVNFISYRMAYVFALAGIIFLLIESSFNYFNPVNEGGFDNYLSLIIVCPAIFIFFCKLNISGNGKRFASLSSAIYFIHPFILKIAEKFLLLGATEVTFLVIILSIISAFLIIKLNSKIKIML